MTNPGLHQKCQTRSQTVVSHDLKFSTSNQHLDTRLDVGLTSIRRLRFQTRVVQSAIELPVYSSILTSILIRYTTVLSLNQFLNVC